MNSTGDDKVEMDHWRDFSCRMKLSYIRFSIAGTIRRIAITGHNPELGEGIRINKIL